MDTPLQRYNTEYGSTYIRAKRYAYVFIVGTDEVRDKEYFA